MPVQTIAEYSVRASGIAKVKRAIADFLPYIEANEPGTKVYAAWQRQDDPTRFVHVFIFEDEAARQIHGASAAMKRFEAAYGPELIEGPLVFTDYDLIGSKGMWPDAVTGVPRLPDDEGKTPDELDASNDE
ncbi:MAG: antibiotic biosynthesis monooxygenase [Devosia sp.]|nr:antibiotic biosynthesis monooxygenase [Devosia sp.]